MRTITRYILGELLTIFTLTLFVMTAFVILVVVAQEAIRQGLGPEPVIRLIPYLLPNALRFAIPGTILFAACSVYGRMSASNEIVAAKSLGIPPKIILRPGWVLALLISLVAVWLNDLAASWGRDGIQRVVMQSLEQIVYGTLRTYRSYRGPNGFHISVRSVDGRRLIQPTITFQSDAGKLTTASAREAEIHRNAATNTLSVIMRDWQIEMSDGARIVDPDEYEFEVPLQDPSRDKDGGKHPTEYALREMSAEVTRQQETIARLEQTLAAVAASQYALGDFSELSQASWTHRHYQLQAARGRLFRLYAEPWRRWANGFSCFFFVWVGAPLAIRMRNSDLMTSFGLCFLPILVLYYPLMAYGADRAKVGALPPYSVWLGNVILLLVGLLLMRKVNRY